MTEFTGIPVPTPEFTGKFTGDKDFDAILRTCLEVLKVKGRDYTIGSADRLQNFKDVGNMVNEPPMKVLATYLWKHVAAVFSYIKSGGQNESEPIELRIVDCINYLLLLGKMVRENEEATRMRRPQDGTGATDDEIRRRLSRP
jgi:hypothetical protein